MIGVMHFKGLDEDRSLYIFQKYQLFDNKIIEKEY